METHPGPWLGLPPHRGVLPAAHLPGAPVSTSASQEVKRFTPGAPLARWRTWGQLSAGRRPPRCTVRSPEPPGRGLPAPRVGPNLLPSVQDERNPCSRPPARSRALSRALSLSRSLALTLLEKSNKFEGARVPISRKMQQRQGQEELSLSGSRLPRKALSLASRALRGAERAGPQAAT